jgi:hypothetical protein
LSIRFLKKQRDYNVRHFHLPNADNIKVPLQFQQFQPLLARITRPQVREVQPILITPPRLAVSSAISAVKPRKAKDRQVFPAGPY